WLLPNHVLLFKASNVLSLDDIAYIAEKYQVWHTSASRDAQLHFIVDLKEVTAYPREVETIRTVLNRRMDKLGWALVITDDFYLEHLAGLFGRLLGFTAKKSASATEAYRFLQSHKDVSLPHNWPDNIDDTMPRRPTV
ncbi:MAG: hypothetical protein AAFQ52_18215, partial [Chloroflexota bacterium]